MMNDCPFCGRSDGDQSSEHWLPDSWEGFFTVPLVLLDSTVVDGSARVRVNNHSPFDIKYSGICKRCNGGWLREIDEDAKGHVIPFATGRATSVSVNSLESLALHLCRTALMTIWGKRVQNGYPAHLFRVFYKTRAVPDGDRIFLGAVNEPVSLGGRHAVLTLDSQPILHFASWSMGRLFALAILPEAGAERLTNIVAATVVERSKRKTQLIWPPPEGPNLSFGKRILSAPVARMIGRPIGLLTADPSERSAPAPDHFTKRLERLDGDFASLIKQASKESE